MHIHLTSLHNSANHWESKEPTCLIELCCWKSCSATPLGYHQELFSISIYRARHVFSEKRKNWDSQLWNHWTRIVLSKGLTYPLRECPYAAMWHCHNTLLHMLLAWHIAEQQQRQSPPPHLQQFSRALYERWDEGAIPYRCLPGMTGPITVISAASVSKILYQLMAVGNLHYWYTSYREARSQVWHQLLRFWSICRTMRAQEIGWEEVSLCCLYDWRRMKVFRTPQPSFAVLWLIMEAAEQPLPSSLLKDSGV